MPVTVAMGDVIDFLQPLASAYLVYPNQIVQLHLHEPVVLGKVFILFCRIISKPSPKQISIKTFP